MGALFSTIKNNKYKLTKLELARFSLGAVRFAGTPCVVDKRQK